MTINEKWEHLKDILSEMGCVVIAYSGGVDSSLLLKAAAEVVGPNLIAVTADSDTYPPSELAQAKDFARSLGVTHRVIRTNELSFEEFVNNPPDRCYFCKKELFGKLKQIAETEAIPFILDGSNTDDLKDYRPGTRAGAEFGVRSPLREALFSKQDVRDCARMVGLAVWDKPSLACLSSRIPYGTKITPKVLKTVQSAEEYLHRAGFKQVRVRHHNDIARIEIDRQDFSKLLAGDIAQKIVAGLKDLGYTYVCIDLEGYRTGSMNEGLAERADHVGVKK